MTLITRDLFLDTSTQINIEDFDPTEDYGGTLSSSECTSAACSMSTSGWSNGDQSMQPDADTMMPLNIVSNMLVSQPDLLSISSLPVTLPAVKVPEHLQLQTQ